MTTTKRAINKAMKTSDNELYEEVEKNTVVWLACVRYMSDTLTQSTVLLLQSIKHSPVIFFSPQTYGVACTRNGRVLLEQFYWSSYLKNLCTDTLTAP